MSGRDEGQVVIEECARDELLARRDTRLLEQILDVVLNGVRRQHERLGDLRVRPALRDQGGHLALTRGYSISLEAQRGALRSARAFEDDRDLTAGRAVGRFLACTRAPASREGREREERRRRPLIGDDRAPQGVKEVVGGRGDELDVVARAEDDEPEYR